MDGIYLRSHFEHEIFPKEKLLAIIDTNGSGMSVTNDLENVCEYIETLENINLQEYKIVYKDTDGYWDGIEYNGANRPISFINIQDRDFFMAKQKINKFYAEKNKK